MRTIEEVVKEIEEAEVCATGAILTGTLEPPLS